MNFGRLRNPKRDMVWVALAGPGQSGHGHRLDGAGVCAGGIGHRRTVFLEMAQAGMLVNLVMFAFNLFSAAPLDGGRILVGLLPMRQAVAVSR